MNEIIPMNEWHFRSAADLNLPILDDPADYQHRMQLKKMTANRDKTNDAQRWSTTALEFTASVHKPKDKSYWAAARLAMMVFDWMGHGRNRAKLASQSPVQQAHEAKCRQCGLIDSQQHLLECKHAPLTAIRANARIEQAEIARKLLNEHAKSRNLQHFIKQFIDRSWSSSTVEPTRLWLGTWTASTLTDMLRQSPTTPMKMSTRDTYIKVVKKLTKPLIDAYYLMLKEVIAASPTSGVQKVHSPPLDYSPTDNHSPSNAQDPSSPLNRSVAMPVRLRQEIEAMHIQEPANCNGGHCRGPSLNCTATLSPFNEYSTTNAALLLEVAASTF
jgi:hypothetical protein